MMTIILHECYSYIQVTQSAEVSNQYHLVIMLSSESLQHCNQWNTNQSLARPPSHPERVPPFWGGG
jgi:hypothetical protein